MLGRVVPVFISIFRTNDPQDLYFTSFYDSNGFHFMCFFFVSNSKLLYSTFLLYQYPKGSLIYGFLFLFGGVLYLGFGFVFGYH